MPGCPLINIARTVGSASAARNAFAIDAYMAAVMAFFFLGLAMTMPATALCSVVSMVTSLSPLESLPHRHMSR